MKKRNLPNLYKNQQQNWFIHELWQFCLYELDELIDSSNMEVNHWNLLCSIIQEKYFHFDAFIILHGTNTMAYTASALSFMIKNLSKPIILTGSMVPLSSTTESSDAISNLEGSILVANSQPKIPEVGIFMDGVFLRGNRTIKVSNRIQRPFKSPKCHPLVFRRLDGTMEYHLEHMMNHDTFLSTEFWFLDSQIAKCIGIIHLFPLISISQIKAQLEDTNLKGVVIVGYGDG